MIAEVTISTPNFDVDVNSPYCIDITIGSGLNLDNEKSGRIQINNDGSGNFIGNVIFDTPFPEGTIYDIFPYAYSQGSSMSFFISNQSLNGFMVTCTAAGYFIYKTLTL